MKKAFFKVILILLATILYSGCQPAYNFTDRELEFRSFGFDFRKFVEKGFLFLPDEYYGEYEVMGTLRVEMHPEVTYPRDREQEGKQRAGDDVYNISRPEQEKSTIGYVQRRFVIGNNLYTQRYKVNDINELLQYIYETSIEMGGDAFTHFKYNTESDQTDRNEKTTYPINVISGIIIKRIP